jgi:hypothetical protein
VQVFAYITEELPVPGTEIMVSRFILTGQGKAMFRAASPAGCKHFTFPAPFWQGSRLGCPKSRIAGLFGKDRQRVSKDIAESVIRVDAVIAGINITVVFYHQRPAALLCMDADRRKFAHPLIEGPFEVQSKGATGGENLKFPF